MKPRTLGRWTLYGSILVFSVLLGIVVFRSGLLPITVDQLVDRYVEFGLAILVSALFTAAILSYEHVGDGGSDAT